VAPQNRTETGSEANGRFEGDAGSHVIPKHQLLRMRLEVQLLGKVLDLMNADVMPEQRDGHDERNELTPVVFDRG
jgi:hypothetical protein